MLKYLCSISVLMLLLVNGCSSIAGPGEITVLLAEDGHLESQGFILKESDLPAFAKEVGTRTVFIQPLGNKPAYGDAIKAKDEMKAAGVAKVVIGTSNGG